MYLSHVYRLMRKLCGGCCDMRERSSWVNLRLKKWGLRGLTDMLTVTFRDILRTRPGPKYQIAVARKKAQWNVAVGEIGTFWWLRKNGLTFEEEVQISVCGAFSEVKMVWECLSDDYVSMGHIRLFKKWLSWAFGRRKMRLLKIGRKNFSNWKTARCVNGHILRAPLNQTCIFLVWRSVG